MTKFDFIMMVTGYIVVAVGGGFVFAAGLIALFTGALKK